MFYKNEKDDSNYNIDNFSFIKTNSSKASINDLFGTYLGISLLVFLYKDFMIICIYTSYLRKCGFPIEQKEHD